MQAFDVAFSAALSKGQVIPAERDDQRGLYDIACKGGEGAKLLEAPAKRPENVHVKPDGHSKDVDADDPASIPKQLAERHEREAEGIGGGDAKSVDEEMAELDSRAIKILAKGEIKDYGEAMQLAAAEMGIADRWPTS